MNKILCLSFFILLSSCSSSRKAVDDSLFIKALSFLEKDNIVVAKPFLIQGCKKGIDAACVSLGKAPNEDDLERVSIMQGATTETQTRINVVLPKNEKLKMINKQKKDILRSRASMKVLIT